MCSSDLPAVLLPPAAVRLSVGAGGVVADAVALAGSDDWGDVPFLEPLDVLVDALARVVPVERDPVLLAQLLAVPDEFMLGDREPRIDVDGVASGLQALRVDLGRRLRDLRFLFRGKSRGDFFIQRFGPFRQQLVLLGVAIGRVAQKRRAGLGG